MGILSWIIFGLIAGILAKWIMPGKDGGGFFMTAARQSKRDTLTTNIGSRLFTFVIVIYMSDAGNRLYRVEIPTS